MIIRNHLANVVNQSRYGIVNDIVLRMKINIESVSINNVSASHRCIPKDMGRYMFHPAAAS